VSWWLLVAVDTDTGFELKVGVYLYASTHIPYHALFLSLSLSPYLFMIAHLHLSPRFHVGLSQEPHAKQ